MLTVGTVVRLKEEYRTMDSEELYEVFYEEVDSEIAQWWADDPKQTATITAYMPVEGGDDISEHYFAVDGDEDIFGECWHLADWFEPVASNTLHSAVEL